MNLDTHQNLCNAEPITVPVSLKEETDAGLFVSGANETKPRGGRPRVIFGSPWEAQGISKATYYRRLKPALPAQAATDQPRWFCIRLQHMTDEAILNVDVAIRNMGFETFYPQIWIPPVAAHRTEAGRAIPARSERLVPLLRSYALVRFDRTHPSWRYLAAFGQVLGKPEWPTPIPDGDIAKLQAGLAQNGVLYPAKSAGSAVGAKKRWIDMATALIALQTEVA